MVYTILTYYKKGFHFLFVLFYQINIIEAHFITHVYLFIENIGNIGNTLFLNCFHGCIVFYRKGIQ